MTIISANVECIFFFFWLHWVFFAALGLSLVVGGGGFSCCGARALGARASVVVARRLSSCGTRASVVVAHGLSGCGSRAQWLWLAGSIVVAHGLSCSAACGIFPDQGSNPCPLHWQEDS